MSNKTSSVVKSVMAVGLVAGFMATADAPARAGDGGAIAAGILGGTALGVLAGTALARPAPPPPPPAYYDGPPPRCWYEPQQVWDGYAYVVRRVRVCQ
jgi:hypothetical protein